MITIYDGLRALQSYGWPGNIRELRNVIERAVALSPGPEIQLANLPASISSAAWGPGCSARVADPADAATGSPLCQAEGEFEAAWIVEALQRHGNNRLRAAVELGISRMTLYRKLHKYGLLGAPASV